jgi:hypothetical protein
LKATLIRTQEQVSKLGGRFYYAFFRAENGKTYRSCLYPNCHNFKRWAKYIDKTNITLDNLNLKGNLVNADSFPIEVKDALR